MCESTSFPLRAIDGDKGNDYLGIAHSCSLFFAPSTALKDKLIRISFSTDPMETVVEETTTPTVPDEGDNKGPDII